ncbi:MAG: archease [Chloroflexota bacterium]|jgi:SHS2 domain-containing protein
MSSETADGAIEIIEHTADWALRVRGRDQAELFRHAARGMAVLLVGERPTFISTETRSISLESYDMEGLLVEWLGELAYWAEQDGFIYQEIEPAEWTPTSIAGTIHGGLSAELQKHIKAVTYHNLAIRHIEGGLEVTIVFDV